MADRLHDRNGIELAAGRPLFPVAALRSMGWIGVEGTSWAVADDDDLHQEPMLVMLWKGATENFDGDEDRPRSVSRLHRLGSAGCRSTGGSGARIPPIRPTVRASVSGFCSPRHERRPPASCSMRLPSFGLSARAGCCG